MELTCFIYAWQSHYHSNWFQMQGEVGTIVPPTSRHQGWTQPPPPAGSLGNRFVLNCCLPPSWDPASLLVCPGGQRKVVIPWEGRRNPEAKM